MVKKTDSQELKCGLFVAIGEFDDYCSSFSHILVM